MQFKRSLLSLLNIREIHYHKENKTNRALSSAEAFCLTDYFIYYYRGERSEEQVTFREKDAAASLRSEEKITSAEESANRGKEIEFSAESNQFEKK